MKINNLDAGLRKTLAAAFQAKGLSNAAAEAKASQQLAAAKTHFHAKLAEGAKTAKTISRRMMSPVAKPAAVKPAAKPAAKLAAAAKAAAKSVAAAASVRAASTGRAKLALARELYDSRQTSSSDNPHVVRAALRSVAVWARTL